MSENTSFVPSIRADYLTVRANSYSETDAGTLNLNVNKQTYRELFTTIDMKAEHTFSVDTKVLASAGYNALNKQIKITSGFAGGGANFTTYGLNPSAWLYNFGVGLNKVAKQSFIFNLKYDTQTNASGYLNQEISFETAIKL